MAKPTTNLNKPNAEAMGRIAATLESLTDRKVFVLVSPMAETAKPTWDGVTMFVPPRDEVAPDAKDYFEAYRDPATGRPVPGTLRVFDLHEQTPAGDRKCFDVVRAIRESLGIKKTPRGFEYTREWGAAGIGVVMDGASLEEIEEVREQGAARYREHGLATAQMTVDAHESMNANRVRQGLQALVDTEEVKIARETVSELSGARREQLRKRFDLDKGVKGAARDLGAGETIKIPAGAPAGA